MMPVHAIIVVRLSTLLASAVLGIMFSLVFYDVLLIASSYDLLNKH
jgi:hypothetical protein